MTTYRITYLYDDGVVEAHEVEATDEVAAIDAAQPDRLGLAGVTDIEIEATGSGGTD